MIIILLVINTIFWLHIGINVYKYILTDKTFDDQYEALRELAEMHPELEWRKTYEALFEKREEGYRKRATKIGNRIIFTFKETNTQTPFIILSITDIVLIAIAFMIIPFIKKSKSLRGKKNENHDER